MATHCQAGLPAIVAGQQRRSSCAPRTRKLAQGVIMQTNVYKQSQVKHLTVLLLMRFQLVFICFFSFIY